MVDKKNKKFSIKSSQNIRRLVGKIYRIGKRQEIKFLKIAL
jgi:hypothetical protein